MDGLGLASSPGGPLVLETFQQQRIGSPAAGIVANRVYLARLPRVVKPRLLSWMDVFVNVAAGNIAGALMTTDDPYETETEALAAEFDRVAHSGEVAAAGSAVFQRLTFASPVWHVPNRDIWAAFGGTSGSFTTGTSATPAGSQVRQATSLMKAGAYSSGIPATLSALADQSTILYLAVG